MKKINFSAARIWKAFAGAFAFTLLLSSCDMIRDWKDRPGPARPGKGTIVQVAAGNPNFQALTAAVVRTGLGPVLNGTGPFTVFAPTDAAFAKLPAPFNNAHAIAHIRDAAQVDALKTILLYHVLAGKVNAANVESGAAATQKPAPNNTIYLSKNSRGIFINGNTKVVQADVEATNGVIHAIDMVLVFPTQNIVQIASGNKAFTALVAAVVKTGLVPTLSGAGDFTVFAPTDAALAKLPAPFNNADNIGKITDAAQIKFLGDVLKYHVVAPARVFSTDLAEGLMAGTVLGADRKLTFSLAGPTVKGKSNPSPSNIEPANLLATNGVVHVIDQVLLP